MSPCNSPKSAARVSFLVPSYNHERFVGALIRSALAQTVPDWELLLVDDCSTDGNADVIRGFDDPRIRLIQHSHNEGINKGLMDAFSVSTGAIVFLIGSDDCLLPDCVERILGVFEDPSVSVSCAPMRYMGEDGVDLDVPLSGLPTDLTPEQLFAALALDQDVLPSPGMAIRREAYARLMPLDVSMLNYQDWQVNVKLAHDYRITLLDAPLVRYRHRATGRTSASSPATSCRESVEMFRLMDTVLSLVEGSVADFVRYFGDRPEIRGMAVEEETIPFLLGLIAAQAGSVSRRKWGLWRILRSISSVRSAEYIHRRYGFQYSDYVRLSAAVGDVETAERDRLYADWALRVRRRVARYRRVCLALVAFSAICLGALAGRWVGWL